MLQETAHELECGQGAQFHFSRPSILVAKGDLIIFQLENAVIADGHPRGTALEEQTQVSATQDTPLGIGIICSSDQGLLEQFLAIGIITKCLDIILIDNCDNDWDLVR